MTLSFGAAAASREVAFNLFGLEVRWYAIILTTGMIVALFLLIFMLKKTGLTAEFGLEIFLWVIPLAVITARLFYTVPRTEYYPVESFDDFIRFFAVWEGGLTIIGGLVGGLLGVSICCLIHKKSIARVADCLVCPVLVGQIIGRWGNFVNQEVYGLAITDPALQKFPIGVFIEATGQWHCATFFYEMMLNLVALIVFFTLFMKIRDKMKPGVMTLAYLFWYNIIRACIEFIKYEPLSTGGVKVLQTMCFVFAGITSVLLVLTQLGIIKWETQKMRLAHFAPPKNPKDKGAAQSASSETAAGTGVGDECAATDKTLSDAEELRTKEDKTDSPPENQGESPQNGENTGDGLRGEQTVTRISFFDKVKDKSKTAAAGCAKGFKSVCGKCAAGAENVRGRLLTLIKKKKDGGDAAENDLKKEEDDR